MTRFDPRNLVLGASAAALLAGLGSAAQAQETIQLTAVSGYPPTVAWTREFRDYYIPQVNERLAETGNYEIVWNEAYSGQIAGPGGELEAIETGLADIGIVVIPFHTDVIPLYAINFYTPFVTADVIAAQTTIDALAEEYPAFMDQWEPLNQVPLASFGVVDSYGVVLTEPVEELSDFEGRRIAGSGANQLWVEGVGATGVSGNLADAYNDLQTGVIDGMVIHAGGALNARLYEVAPYMVVADLGAVDSFVLTVNRDRWESLPEEVQTVLDDVAADYAEHTALAGREDTAEGMQVIAEEGTVIELPAEMRQEWAQTMPNIAQDWAADMEELGYPGSEILEAYMERMRELNQPIARQWDQE
jgi:TRAP-type C4-dicarboxylate transport system substrate-binding protein